MTLESVARGLVDIRFPGAHGALLAGSAGTGYATPTSDLDVVVFLDGPPAPFRETVRHDGRLVELFVHTRASWRQFVEREVRVRRSPLLHMCAEGRPVVDVGGVLADVQQDARRLLAAGPAPLSEREREDRRYVLTDLLDDLAGSQDDDEVVHVGARVMTSAMELALLERQSWLGIGKWLHRRLATVAPDLARDLVAAYRRLVAARDRRQLAVVAGRVLAESGGPLAEGYHRAAPSG